MALKKYFIAIIIPSPFFEQIEGLKHLLLEEHGLKGALRSPSHITLHRPFEWKEEKESVLVEKLKTFSFEKQFDIDLKNFAWFEPRVIYIDVIDNPFMRDLHDTLAQFAKRELKLFNESDDLRGFHPHVTIAFRDLKKPKFYALKNEFETQKFEGKFRYTGFSVLKLEEKWKELIRFDNF